MALFGKKKTVTCALCGKEAKSGFLRGLFQREIEGQYVCDDCYGEVDLPTSFTVNMTLNQLREYKAFREENQKLKHSFQITDEIDFGVLEEKFYFDTVHNRMCLDKKLEKTIFEGRQIRSFTIREDEFEIFRGNTAGLIQNESNVRRQVTLAEPQIRKYSIDLQSYQGRLDRAPDDQKDQIRSQKPIPQFNTKPFHKFRVEVHLDHPYWKTITAELAAPDFSNTHPNAQDYLMEYQKRYNIMQQLAMALTAVMGAQRF